MPAMRYAREIKHHTLKIDGLLFKGERAIPETVIIPREVRAVNEKDHLALPALAIERLFSVPLLPCVGALYVIPYERERVVADCVAHDLSSSVCGEYACGLGALQRPRR